MRMPAVSRLGAIAAGLATTQSLQAHQSCHAVASVPAAVGAESRDDPGTALGLAAAEVEIGDLLGQVAILPGTRSGDDFAFSPVIVSTDRDFEHLAKSFDWIIEFHSRNPEEAFGVGSERIPKVFFKMSRCSLRCRISRRAASSWV